MSGTALVAATTILFEVIPILCHRLITNPYPDAEWDSIVVSSDPIIIKEKRENEVAAPKPHPLAKPQKRSFENCPENDFRCLYGDSEDNSSNQIVNRFIEQYSGIANVNVAQDERNETFEMENDNSRKSYWSMIETQTHHHPYNDKNGWVTLEPVPWSTSKISKWKPTKVGAHEENAHWDYAPPSTHRPVQQFWVGGSGSSNQRPSTQWGIGSNDIITDNQPSGFPKGQHNNVYPNPSYEHRPQSEYYGHPNNYQEYHQNQGYKENHPSKFQHNAHPSTYPSSGKGEWILLSTTRGYSVPQRHRWPGKSEKNDGRMYGSRKVKQDISRYHEENLSEKEVTAEGVASPVGSRKSDETTGSSEVATQTEQKENETSVQGIENAPIQVLYTGSPKSDEPVKTFKRKVRLQVLPSLKNSSTSHGGLLEVDANSQTVDEAQQEDEKLKNLKAIANVKKNKIRGYKLVPVKRFSGKGMSNKSKSAMALAAVGAGMIPATMALLVPMALGRKRRSLLPRKANLLAHW